MPSALRRAWLRRWLGTALGAGLGNRLMAAQDAAPPAPATPTGALGDDPDRVAPDHTLRFPRDHGAHPGAAIEWWYATGWLQPSDGDADGANASGQPPQPSHGFQITFFRSRTPVADAPASLSAGRFAPRQLLFAHAAVTDLGGARHRHAQRIARWSGDETQPEAHALRTDTGLVLGPWRLAREPQGAGTVGRYSSRIAAPEAGFDLALTLAATQPLLLQGQAGWSQKGPSVAQASHYYSQPQLAVRAELSLDGRRQRLRGLGWLDHEWSHALLADDAVGWDWIGVNLFDGGALTAFQLRRADGTVLWAGGSHRPAGGAVQAFGPQALRFSPGQRWRSPDTGASYPVQWRIATPVGVFDLRALLDAQELDSRASTGAVYWEGLAELRDSTDRPVGLGYLEMTGRAGALRLSG